MVEDKTDETEEVAKVEVKTQNSKNFWSNFFRPKIYLTPNQSLILSFQVTVETSETPTVAVSQSSESKYHKYSHEFQDFLIARVCSVLVFFLSSKSVSIGRGHSGELPSTD